MINLIKKNIPKKRTVLKEWEQIILCTFISVTLSILILNSHLVDTWERKSWDWLESMMACPSHHTDEIRLILVDQGSIDWMSNVNGINWPWPREIYGVVTNFCKRSEAKALAFDVLFTEPSIYGAEDDSKFSASIKNFGRTASAAFLKKLSGSHTRWPEEAVNIHFILDGSEHWLKTSSGNASLFPRAVMPIPEVSSATSILCNVQQEPDPDGIYRRIRVLGSFDGHMVPNLGLGVYLAGEIGITAKRRARSNKGRISEFSVEIDGKKIPMDSNGETILRYRGPSGTHKSYSASSIIQNEIEYRNSTDGAGSDLDKKNSAVHNNKRGIDPADFKGKYVFFSLSAPGLYDLRSAPVDSVYPGVEIQATMLDNFLSGDFIKESSLPALIACITAISLLCSILMTFIGQSALLPLAGAGCMALAVVISWAAYSNGLWLPLIAQELAILITIFLALVFNYAREGRQKKFIRNAFSQYLTPLLVDQLIKHPEKLKLGGERKELSIFFSDLQGFTSISERLSPEELTSLLNTYLSAMTEIIHEEGGTVDKYEGDAIIAFWNAPLDVDNHAYRSVRAALKCQKKLTEMQPDLKIRAGTEVKMRIGLNTGHAVVGNMGSNSRFDYTMLGDSVNLAARLEGANKEFGTYTMISSSTLNAMKSGGDTQNEFEFREIARLVVVGKKEAVTVFEPMFSENFRSDEERYMAFNRGLQYFYSGELGMAADLFSEIADIDAPASAYHGKCVSILHDEKDRLDNWEGVWTMTKK